jgi:hypothetical protein
MYTRLANQRAIRMVEYAKEIGIAVSLAIILAGTLGAGAVYFFPYVTNTNSSNTSSGNSSTVSSMSSSVSTAPPPCGSPGVYCGGFNITSASLTVRGNYSILQVTILETGNMYIGSATVSINGTIIGAPPASENEPPGNILLNIQPGQQAVLVLTIPNSTISIRAGLAYSVQVEDWEGAPGGPANAGGGTVTYVTAS